MTTTLAFHSLGAPAADLRPGRVPLVLLHGFPLDRRMWQPVAALSADLPVLAVDLPGFGDSPAAAGLPPVAGAPSGPCLDAGVEALAADLGALGVDRAVVAGLSMGGYVAMGLARRRPELLAGIGLLDTKAGADDEAARAGRYAVADRVESEGTLDAVAPMSVTLLSEPTRRRDPHLVSTLAAWIADAEPAAVAWSQRAMATRPDSFEALGALRVPAAVVVGELDPLAPPAEARAMVEVLSDPVLTVVPGAGHMTAVEDPAVTAGALRDLYERCV